MRRPTLLQLLVFLLGAALAVLSFDGLTAAALKSDAVHHQWLAYVWAGSVDLLWISAVVAIRRSSGGRRVAAVAVLLVGLSASLMQVWTPPTWAARLVPPVGLLLAVLLEVYVVTGKDRPRTAEDRPRTAPAEQDRQEDRGRTAQRTADPVLHPTLAVLPQVNSRTAQDRTGPPEDRQEDRTGPPTDDDTTDNDTWPDPEDPQMTAKDRAAELMRTAPELSTAELAARLGVSDGYIRKVRRKLAAERNGHERTPA